MSKVEQLRKLFGDKMTARANAVPAAEPTGPRLPDPDDGRTTDIQSGREFMLVKNIVPDPNQPRKAFDPVEIQQIAASYKTHGQLMPLRVEWKAELGKWQIEEGEKRWIAAQAAGIDRLWCMFIQKETPEDERLEKQLLVNCLRSDLKDIERAHAFKRLMAMKGWNGARLAAHLHLHPGTVSRALALLEPMVAGKIPTNEGGGDEKELRGAIISGEPGGQGGLEGREELRGAINSPAKPDKPAQPRGKKKTAAKGKRGPKGGRVHTYRLQGCTVTMTFTKAPTAEEMEAAAAELHAKLTLRQEQAA